VRVDNDSLSGLNGRDHVMNWQRSPLGETRQDPVRRSEGLQAETSGAGREIPRI
jgi:hypothetical protein